MKHSQDHRWSTGLAIAGVLLVCVATSPLEAQGSRRLARRMQQALSRYQEQHNKYHGKLSAKLEELAAYCNEKKFTTAAQKIRKLATPADTQVLSVNSLPTHLQAAIPISLPADERYWRVQLRHAQRDYAKKLYSLSGRVLRAGYPSYAYQLVWETASHDPDHKLARQLLGHVRQGKQWVTPFTADKIRKRYVWHDKFGWLPKNHVVRYEKGERHFKRRWISAAQETEIRRDFRKAWKIQTDHYLVKTNHSLERGVEIARALETFYDFFSPTFAGFFNTPEQMKKLFEGSRGSSRSKKRRRPYEVHYYRTRDEYNNRLRKKIPQIAITNGLYLTDDRVAYFYHDPKVNNDPTLFHEATHQLFYESTQRNRLVGHQQHFWIIEGISCYMESCKYEGGRISLGDPRFIRFNAARYRYLVDGYYVPLRDFAAMGMEQFQNAQENISRNYSQASGLSHFFMHYDGGRYRDALIEHLSQLYRANPRRLSAAKSLEELTGVDYEELDRQYGNYLKNLQESLTPQRSQN